MTDNDMTERRNPDDADPADGDVVDAQIVDGEVVDGGVVDGEVVDGEVVDAGSLDAEADAGEAIELPDDPQEAVSVLITELMAARSAAAEATGHWQRVAAEFENFRKRSQRDQDDLIARASERIAVQLLPVLDSLDAAMDLEPETESETKMLSGMNGTRELLLATLAREGVEPIEALDSEFDPAVHEAVQVGEGSGRMMVEAELRRGYTLRGKVLRASLVVVGYENGESPSEATPSA